LASSCLFRHHRTPLFRFCVYGSPRTVIIYIDGVICDVKVKLPFYENDARYDGDNGQVVLLLTFLTGVAGFFPAMRAEKGNQDTPLP
jgi:hypothetical protein